MAIQGLQGVKMLSRQQKLNPRKVLWFKVFLLTKLNDGTERVVYTDAD
jgi:hypothetical protein